MSVCMEVWCPGCNGYVYVDADAVLCPVDNAPLDWDDAGEYEPGPDQDDYWIR